MDAEPKSIKEHLTAMAKDHPDMDHYHVAGHEDGFTVHHAAGGMKAKGPVEMKSMKEVKSHMADCMDGEGEGM